MIEKWLNEPAPPDLDLDHPPQQKACPFCEEPSYIHPSWSTGDSVVWECGICDRLWVVTYG